MLEVMATHRLTLMLLFLEVMATHRLSSLSLEAMATYQLPTLFLEVMDFNSTCWPFIIQPDGFHRLLLFAFPHAREIFLEVLDIDGYRKLDTVKFFKHVRISRQGLINLVRPMPSRRPLTILPVFSSQW